MNRPVIHLDFFPIPGFWDRANWPTEPSYATSFPNQEPTNLGSTFATPESGAQTSLTTSNGGTDPHVPAESSRSFQRTEAPARLSEKLGPNSCLTHGLGITYSSSGPTHRAWTLLPRSRRPAMDYDALLEGSAEASTATQPLCGNDPCLTSLSPSSLSQVAGPSTTRNSFEAEKRLLPMPPMPSIGRRSRMDTPCPKANNFGNG